MKFNIFKNNPEKILKKLEKNLFKIEYLNNKINKKNLELLNEIIKINEIEGISEIINYFQLDEYDFIIKLLKNNWIDKKIIYKYLINKGKINDYIIEYPSYFWEYILEESKNNIIFLKFLIDNEIYLNFKNEEEFYQFFKIIEQQNTDIQYLLTKNNILFYFKFLLLSYILNIKYKTEYEEYLLKIYKKLNLKLSTVNLIVLLRIEEKFFYEYFEKIQAGIKEIIYKTNNEIKINSNIILKDYIDKNNFYYYFNLFFLNILDTEIITDNLIKKEYERYFLPFLKEYNFLTNWKIEIYFLTELFKNKQVNSKLILKLFIDMFYKYDIHKLKLFKKELKYIIKKYNTVLKNIIMQNSSNENKNILLKKCKNILNMEE